MRTHPIGRSPEMESRPKEWVQLIAKTWPQLLTAEEAAKYLRLHVKSVYRLVKEEKIPGRKVGGRWRFNPEVMETWFTKQKGA